MVFRQIHPPTSLWHPLNVPLPRAPSKRELQHGRRPVAFAALFTTKARDRPAVEALVEAGFEEGRAADRATTMLEAPARRGPWGERHVQRMPEADSEGVFGFREPLRLQPRHIKNRSPRGEMFDASRFSANNGRRQAFGRLMRNKTFCIVKCRMASEFHAADVLAPAPGQGLRPDVLGSGGPNTPAAGPSLRLGAVCKTGWGGGRNSAGAVPAFDPHPSLSCSPRRAAGSTRRLACWVHRTHARPAAAPAGGRSISRLPPH